MKPLLLCGIALVGSSAAFAQPPAPPETEAQRTITLTGCVGGGANAQPVTLTSAMAIPATEQAGAVTPSPVPTVVSPTPTQPVARAGQAGKPAETATMPAPGAVGTSGTLNASGAVGTSGTVSTTGAVVAGTAPAGSSASSITGYRLSGTDMSKWMGRRVQIVGSLVPSAPGSAPASAIGGARIGPDGAPVLPELRVVSVSPATGDCSR